MVAFQIRFWFCSVGVVWIDGKRRLHVSLINETLHVAISDHSVYLFSEKNLGNVAIMTGGIAAAP